MQLEQIYLCEAHREEAHMQESNHNDQAGL